MIKKNHSWVPESWVFMAVEIPCPGNSREHLTAKLLQFGYIWDITVVEFTNEKCTELLLWEFLLLFISTLISLLLHSSSYHDHTWYGWVAATVSRTGWAGWVELPVHPPQATCCVSLLKRMKNCQLSFTSSHLYLHDTLLQQLVALFLTDCIRR